MKTLLVIRHAKSSWTNFAKPDFDRPLNDRGNRDAPDMVKKVLKRNIGIDAFVSSPALRAKQTCTHFCNGYGRDPAKIIFVEKLYHASLKTFYDVVHELDNQYSNVALFSHNPGITDFADSLCENIRINNMPTCGVLAVRLDIKKWTDFVKLKADYLFFDYPKS